MNANNQLYVIPSPYIKSSLSYNRMMLDKCIAVSILALGGVYFWGIPALVTVVWSTLVAVITEYVAWKLMKKQPRLQDYSAITIGITLALFLPVGVPLWVVALGSIFAILFGKMAFGGIAYTPFAPVAVGYAMINAAWSQYLSPGEIDVDMYAKRELLARADYVSSTSDIPLEIELADPLTQLKSYGVDSLEFIFSDYLFGNQLTVIGATSLALILLVLAFLLVRRVLSIGIVCGYLLGITFFSYLVYMHDSSTYPDPLFILSTGTVLLSLILLTDFATIPTSCVARIIYGVAVGAILVFLRTYTDIFDGTVLAILLASFLSPYCDMIRIKKVSKGGY